MKFFSGQKAVHSVPFYLSLLHIFITVWTPTGIEITAINSIYSLSAPLSVVTYVTGLVKCVT